jgi:hypothetical protein
MFAITRTSSLLARHKRVDLRNVWTNEAASFTPWLAQDESLKPLAETLGLDLALKVSSRAQAHSEPTFCAKR